MIAGEEEQGAAFEVQFDPALEADRAGEPDPGGNDHPAAARGRAGGDSLLDGCSAEGMAVACRAEIADRDRPVRNDGRLESLRESSGAGSGRRGLGEAHGQQEAPCGEA